MDINEIRAEEKYITLSIGKKKKKERRGFRMNTWVTPVLNEDDFAKETERICPDAGRKLAWSQENCTQ